MIGGWMPWKRLLWVWLPPVLLCLAAVVFYLWQSSGTLGRGAQLEVKVRELEEKIAQLQKVSRDMDNDREQVAEMDAGLQRVYTEVFGSLDERLTDILREVETASRNAQMLPLKLSYRAETDQRLECVRFGISYSVSGQYEQVRKMLAAVQSSPEFLIVESIGFRGEEEPTSREIRIMVKLATYLAEADPERLRLLTGGAVAGGDSDG